MKVMADHSKLRTDALVAGVDAVFAHDIPAADRLESLADEAQQVLAQNDVFERDAREKFVQLASHIYSQVRSSPRRRLTRPLPIATAPQVLQAR